MGYAGGEKKNPTYRDLGDHTETIQLDFDPRKISYEQLLDIFRQSHNPSAHAISIQYKHVVFYHTDEQKELAVRSKYRVTKKLGREIQTEILPYTGFYRAEDYHQKYKLRHAHDIMAEFDNMYPDYQDFVDSTAAARINGSLYGYGTLENLQAEMDSYGISEEAKEKLEARISKNETNPKL